MKEIPLVDLGWQHRQVRKEVELGWERVTSSSSYVLGPELEDFENEFARYVGLRHCIGVGNGTDALELALRALDVGAGDEVIVPTNSFVASVVAVLRAGARPVLVDVDPTSYLVEAERVAAAITSRTKVIMPVHLFGQLVPTEDIAGIVRGRPIAILEDGAQAHGARRNGNSMGHQSQAVATSFYPGKNLGAYGDGGAILTDSSPLAERLGRLRNLGTAAKYHHPEVGFNSRLDSLQAVVLSAKLRHLDAWNDLRRAAANYYGWLLEDLEEVHLPTVLPGNDHAWHLYVIRVPDRDRVGQRLRDEGVGTGVHYPIPIHLQGGFANLGNGPGDFPVAERLAGEILSLPIYPGITEDDQERVADCLRKALR